MTCSAADYEAAAAAICNVIALDAQTRKSVDSKTAFKALLDVSEFHDRCMRLARSISFQRAQDNRVACAVGEDRS